MFTAVNHENDNHFNLRPNPHGPLDKKHKCAYNDIQLLLNLIPWQAFHKFRQNVFTILLAELNVTVFFQLELLLWQGGQKM